MGRGCGEIVGIASPSFLPAYSCSWCRVLVTSFEEAEEIVNEVVWEKEYAAEDANTNNTHLYMQIFLTQEKVSACVCVCVFVCVRLYLWMLLRQTNECVSRVGVCV